MSSRRVVDESRSTISEDEPIEGFSYSTWTTAPATDRSSDGIFVVVVAPIGMFIFGAVLGVVLQAVISAKSGSQLAIVNSTQCNPGATLPQTPLPCDKSSPSSYRDDKPETTTALAYNVSEMIYCSDFPWRNFRLPRDVAPFSYNLTIHPNITNKNLTGSVAIDIKVLRKTKLIVLHSEKLVAIKFDIRVNSKSKDPELYACPGLSQWAFVLKNNVVPGDVVELRIEFYGRVRKDKHGLYISTHVDAFGNKTQSAVTQFEAIHAREMFPCFDEPNFKATFQLSVVREAHHITRSNMEIKVSKEYADGLYMDVYHRTVKMSTYLLAVAILDNYSYVQGWTKNTNRPIKVRVYAPQDMIEGQSEFGLDTAIRALEYFEEYSNIPYQLEKIDLVGLDDFQSGAMENWGLMTFRYTGLLYADGIKIARQKEQVALVICHEVAHQWFGNLVTMDWWNDLWLNEGFATYFQFLCVDRLYPEWNIMTQFYERSVIPSHGADILRGSRPVSSHTFKIRSLFDVMSYQKASVIIRMVESLVGKRKFRLSLIEYLNKYAYANAKGSDLWEIVEKYAALHGISLQNMANAYIKQAGCPEIFVTLSDKEITVHNQTRHFIHGGMRDDDTKWTIPIHYRTNSQPESRLKWMRASQNKVSWSLFKSSKWVVVNTDSLSYVRVLYDAKNYAELAKQLLFDHTVFSAVERTMILVNAFDFAMSSKLNIKAYLNLLQYASEEMDYSVWLAISAQMNYIDSLIQETPFVNIFRDFQRTLVSRPYEKIGWSTNTSMTPAQKGLQVALIRNACRLRNRDCIKQAHLRYKEWIMKDKKPSLELFMLILSEGVRQGGRQAWDSAYATFLESKEQDKQVLTAMASTTRSALISRILQLCLEGPPFRRYFSYLVLIEFSKTSANRALTWRFFRVNYKVFHKMFVGNSLVLNYIIGEMNRIVSTQEDLDEVKAFLRATQLKDSKGTLNPVFRQIELNINWRRLHEESLRQWLHDWDKSRRRKLHH